MQPLVGQIVEERYQIEAELGCGAMGTVFRARHVRIGREVAIKVLHAHLMRDPAMIARFDREAAIAARLAHRNVVALIDVGETAEHQKLMVLELARGDSLAAIAARGPLAPARVVHLTAELLRGLAHAHAAGLVHRDLKPENVIVEHDDHGAEVPRIVDFGIAVLREPDTSDATRRLTSAGMVLGTPAYMAPEQAQGFAPDPRTDLFALGVIVYELLAGVQPFEGTSMEIVLANMSLDPPAVHARAGIDVDPLLEAFARKLMARDVEARFASADAALAMLRLIDADRAAAARALDVVLRVPREVRATVREAMQPLVVAAPDDAEAPSAPPVVARRARPSLVVAAVLLLIGGLAGWCLGAAHARTPPASELASAR